MTANTRPLFADWRTHRPDFTSSEYTTEHLRPELEALAERAGADSFERVRLSIVLDALERIPDDLNDYIEERTEEAIEHATERLQEDLEDAKYYMGQVEERAMDAEREAIETTIGGLPKRWISIDLATLPEATQKRARKLASEHRRYRTEPKFIVTDNAGGKISSFGLGDMVNQAEQFSLDTPEADRLWIVRGYKC